MMQPAAGGRTLARHTQRTTASAHIYAYACTQPQGIACAHLGGLRIRTQTPIKSFREDEA